MADEPPDLVEVLQGFTNFVQNERVRSYNEGLDAGIAQERMRCAKIAEGEIDPTDYVSSAKTILSYINSGAASGTSGHG